MAVRFAAVGERLSRIPALAFDAAVAATVAVANGFAIGAEQELGAKDPDALAMYWAWRSPRRCLSGGAGHWPS